MSDITTTDSFGLNIFIVIAVVRLQDQLGVLRASKPLECSSNVDEWEDLLTRKRRQIKKKKEQLRRIEDDG